MSQLLRLQAQPARMRAADGVALQEGHPPAVPWPEGLTTVPEAGPGRLPPGTQQWETARLHQHQCLPALEPAALVALSCPAWTACCCWLQIQEGC